MSTPSGAEARYADISKKLTPVVSAGAAGISLLQVAALWGSWWQIGILVVVQVALLVFNVWVNVSLLARYGARVELVRATVNIGGALAIVVFVGFTLPVWLWIPFVALSYDHLGRRASLGVLLAVAVAFTTFGLVSGRSWIEAIAFLCFTAFCWEIGRVRFLTYRDMLSRSDEQRAELERAHAQIQAAHERLKLEVAARERIELELRSSQKLEAVGRLASGIAHEINTPVQFVSDSVHFIREGIDELVTSIERNRDLRARALDGAPLAEVIALAEAGEEKSDVAYLVDHMPKAARRALDGLDRISNIVRSLKRFAHHDQGEASAVDLNQAIESTLVIARHEYKLVAEVDAQLDPEIPLFTCRAGEINQVILNLLVNAAHAIGDAVAGTERRGTITVRSEHGEGEIRISVSDTGTGIPEAVRHRIFEPFFTTKDVGRGTGQGLAISRSVIAQHGGTLAFETEIGRGTTFMIRLPVATEHAHAA